MPDYRVDADFGMRVIIAGSRTIDDLRLVDRAMRECGWADRIEEIVSGGARGVDFLGQLWARAHSVRVEVFRADWRRGRSAGFERNLKMAEYADALVAVWDGKSKGTEHMIGVMRKLGKPVYVVTV